MKPKQNETANIIITKQGFIPDYSIMPDNPAAREWLQLAESDKYRALFKLGFTDAAPWFSPSLNYVYELAGQFISQLTRQPDLEIKREQINVVPSAKDCSFYIERAPFVPGIEFITDEWIINIWQQLNQVYVTEIRAFTGSVQEYLTSFNDSIKIVGRVFFHLVENKNDDFYPFAFMASYSVTDHQNQSKHVSLKYALTEYQDDVQQLLKLLSTVTEASANSDFISALMESGELFAPIRLTAREAYQFLREIPIYEQAGILCRVPDWWTKKYSQPGLSLNIGEKKPSLVGVEALVSFSPKLTLNGEVLTAAEVKGLLQQEEGLALLKGKWVEIDHDKLNQLLAAYEQAGMMAGEGGVTLLDAMRMELNMNAGKTSPVPDGVQVKNGQWMKELRTRLNRPDSMMKQPLPKDFHASLRPYQHDGYNWLSYMNRLGFGACLADDMGLGKTIQVIAWLQSLYETGRGQVLLILPASLLGNWQKELIKFAPMMPFEILHGQTDEHITAATATGFLFLTTYGMVARSLALQKKNWTMVILDEAQAIKNPGTKQTKAIKQLRAAGKIALTGTPIENRLSDLWSLFDFLNPGLLGSAKEFSTFAKSLPQNAEGYIRLKSVINPFLLRRMKTDKAVITDLPDKLEKKEYTGLSKKQTALYMKLIEELRQTLEHAEGIQKKGLVLSSIMKFKQICNHPDQYIGQNKFKENDSGKFERLKEICETIYEKRERVLVFTQFREMVEPLADYLENVFHQSGLCLHGGTTVKKRQDLVDAFNGEAYVPFMVLSVKAGGVGLNLTAANHVIHFDRWWNPAVENQATDRAFRIGQKKHVIVYKFITQGTIEEKIDLMIEEKQELAGSLIASSGEKWITDLSDQELISLLQLEGGRR